MHLTPASSDERGFTTLELMIACMIMMIVVAIAGGVLFSISAAANRNDSVISIQQKASNIITTLSRDVRSTASLSFPTATPATEVELTDYQMSGSTETTVNVIWLYSTTASVCTTASVSSPCLIRETQVNGTFVPNPNLSIALANNTSTNPPLTYYTFSDPTTPLASTDTTTEFSTCTTAIGIDLIVSKSTNNLTSKFEDTGQAALTNQMNLLTAPGNGECR